LVEKSTSIAANLHPGSGQATKPLAIRLIYIMRTNVDQPFTTPLALVNQIT